MDTATSKLQSDCVYVCMYVRMCFCVCVRVYIHRYVCVQLGGREAEDERRGPFYFFGEHIQYV